MIEFYFLFIFTHAFGQLWCADGSVQPTAQHIRAGAFKLSGTFIIRYIRTYSIHLAFSLPCPGLTQSCQSPVISPHALVQVTPDMQDEISTEAKKRRGHKTKTGNEI